MRWLRWLGVLALVLVVLVVVLVVALNTIDWSRYQEPVIEQVRAATGRDLRIEGELDIHVGFRPSVSVAGVQFANADWGSAPEMVRVGNFEVQLALLPLLFQQVDVRRIVLEDAEILLETDAEGRGNWEFETAEAEAPAEPEPEAPTPEEDAAEGGDLLALVREVVIRDTVFTYRDGQAGTTTEAGIDSLSMQAEDFDAPLLIELAARYQGEPIGLSGTIGGAFGAMAGEPVDLDLAAELGGARIGVEGGIAEPLAASGLDLKLDVAGDSVATLGPLAGGDLPAIGPYQIAARVRGGGDRYEVSDLELRMAESVLRGQVTAALGGARPAIDAELTSPGLDLADFQGESDGGPPAEGDATEPAPSAPSDRVFSDEPLALDGLRAADAKLALKVDSLKVDGLTVSGISLGVDLEAGRLRVSPLAAAVAEGRIDGDVALDASSSTPSLKLALNVDQVDAGTLLNQLDTTDALTGGRVDLAVDVAGRGGSLHALMAGLGGNVGLEMGPGRLQLGLVQGFVAELASMLATGGGSRDRTALNCAVARFVVKEGVAKAKGLAVDTATFGMLGSGRVDLGREVLDLRFDPVAKRLSAGHVAPSAAITGTLAAPEAGIHKGAVVGKAVDVATRLAGGKSVAKGSTFETSEGIAGCEELIANRKQLTGGKKGDKGLQKDAQKSLDKASEQLGDKAGKAVDKALDGLFGR